mmetsp:Transcript_23832/g.74985  ORF Transcript_23832/g.74985 Transcript_23832/m.74985 type:complete len:806 (-) Transcript_23832:1690-4107(-)
MGRVPGRSRLADPAAKATAIRRPSAGPTDNQGRKLSQLTKRNTIGPSAKNNGNSGGNKFASPLTSMAEGSDFFDIPDEETLREWLHQQREAKPWFGDIIDVLASTLGFVNFLRFVKREAGDDDGPGGPISTLMFLSECFKFRNDYMFMRDEANRIVRVFLDNHQPIYVSGDLMGDFAFVSNLCWRSKEEGFHQLMLEDQRKEIEMDMDKTVRRLVRCSNVLVYSIKERLSGESFAVSGNEFDDAEKVALLSLVDSGLVTRYFSSPEYKELLQYFYARRVPVVATDFHMYSKIHNGRFGTSHVAAQLNTTGGFFTLKRMPVPAADAETRTHFGKCAWTQLSSLADTPRNDFIESLYWAFRHEEEIVLVTTLLTGGSLATHYTESGNFDDSAIRFYVSRAALGLAHLHSAGFVYRNLSPHSICLDSWGRSYLTDFSFAHKIDGSKKPRGVYGAKGYVAPEMFEFDDEEGDAMPYSFAADWFSLGCLTHYMATGSSPFDTEEALAFAEGLHLETSESLQDIATRRYDPFTDTDVAANSPATTLGSAMRRVSHHENHDGEDHAHVDQEVYNSMHHELKKMMEKLLKKDPETRLGAGGVPQVLGHRFFHGYDIEGIMFNNMRPPHKPKQVDVTIAGNAGGGEGMSPRNSSFVPFDNEHTTTDNNLANVHIGTGVSIRQGQGAPADGDAAAGTGDDEFASWSFNNEGVIDFEFLRYQLMESENARNPDEASCPNSPANKQMSSPTPLRRERHRGSFVKGSARIAAEPQRSFNRELPRYGTIANMTATLSKDANKLSEREKTTGRTKSCVIC